MTKLASRIAGSRLLAIMLVLLLPMALLGNLVVQQLRKNIAFTDNQLVGLEAVKHAMPLLIGRASGRLDRDKAASALEKVRSHSAAIGITSDFETFSRSLLEDGQNLPATLTDLSYFISKIGAQSNLLLDSNPETYFLGLAATNNLPNMTVELSGVADGLYGTMVTFGADDGMVRRLIWSLGRLQESADQTAEAVFRASVASKSPSSYTTATRLMNEVRNSVNFLARTTIGGADKDKGSIIMAVSDARLATVKRYELVQEIHGYATARLEKSLKERVQGLRNDLRNLLALVFGCVLLAAGGSFMLFRNTLRRLDHVETERLRAEAMGDRVNAVNDDLSRVNRELADKMASLKQAQDELISKRRMEQLGQLTATIAHEIRNPLGSVRTSAFLLEKKLANKNLGIEMQIERINKGVVRCDNIITQLLDYSRTKVVQSKLANLDDWLVGIVGEEAQRLPQQVELECELGLGGAEVPFDAARLQRAVINLLNNASEAMITDSRERESGKPMLIRVTTSFADDMAMLRVSDTGPGISRENLAKVREPLFTTKSFGTGLGIPAIEQIATQHGGRLEIDSVLGQGASFTLYLPLNVTGDPQVQKVA